jgi:hypothetical protein
MAAISRPMPSPALQREVPSEVHPFWPALMQQYDRVGYTQLMDLGDCDEHDAVRPVEAERARDALPMLAQARRDGTADPVYLELAQVAAHLKLGHLQMAQAHLRTVASTHILDASLAGPPRLAHELLIGAHPLWLVMHVAIEAGLGSEMVPEVLNSGLRQRLGLEPELSAGLLLNALRNGDSGAISQLQAAGLRLTPRAQGLLERDLARFTASLAARAQRGVVLQTKESRYLQACCRALTLLGKGAEAKRLLDMQRSVTQSSSVQSRYAWRRFLPLPSHQGPAVSPPPGRSQR